MDSLLTKKNHFSLLNSPSFLLLSLFLIIIKNLINILLVHQGKDLH